MVYSTVISETQAFRNLYFQYVDCMHCLQVVGKVTVARCKWNNCRTLSDVICNYIKPLDISIPYNTILKGSVLCFITRNAIAGCNDQLQQFLTMAEWPSSRSSLNLLLLSSIGRSLYAVYFTWWQKQLLWCKQRNQQTERSCNKVKLTSISCTSFLKSSSVSNFVFWSGTTRGMATRLVQQSSNKCAHGQKVLT